MASQALHRWQGERAARLDELLAAHKVVRGPGRGGRWRTQQLNYALVLRLAVEFQGFTRELHDAASDTFATWAAGTNPALEGVIRARLTEGRQIDRGNAHPGSLGSDFGRLGFYLWPALVARDPASEAQQQALDVLNRARNAIAHDDEAALSDLRASGLPIRLTTFNRWRRALDHLAANLDAEVGEHLGLLFGQPPPW